MKKDLLLLHGAIGTKDQFKQLVPLLKTYFNCHTIDFSGHGENGIPNKPFSVELFAEDVTQWMDENKISSINIFGYSMGGYVALYLASQFPEKVQNIFTLSTKLDWTAESSVKEVQLLNADKIAEKVPKFAALLMERHSDWKTVLGKTAEMMLNLGKKPPLSKYDFQKINHNTLLATGDKDKTATAQETLATQRLIPNSQLLILPNSGHPFEQVDIETLGMHMVKFFNSL